MLNIVPVRRPRDIVVSRPTTSLLSLFVNSVECGCTVQSGSVDHRSALSPGYQGHSWSFSVVPDPRFLYPDSCIDIIDNKYTRALQFPC